MRATSPQIWLLGVLLLSACGPAGVLSGKVTVEGGMAGGIAVIIYGPQSAATVTSEAGAFTIGNLPDGVYVVRATVRGADVEEVSASTIIAQGKAAPEPILAFRQSTAKVVGRVVFADGSGAQEVTVTATGPETRGTRTAADGSFTFDNLKTGAYVVSVEGPDTLEGRVAIGVNASGSGGNTGELRLTPVGRFGGTVVFGAAPVAGATVFVTGTNLSSVTDAMGRFAFIGVPTGMQGVSVRIGTSPFFRSATAMVTVARGANPDVALTLTDDPPKTGAVTGTVTFHGPRSPRDITVNVPGSGVTATPQVNGAYSLTLPIGSWDVVANAPQHPPKLLGRVTVIEGSTQSLPGAEVSWWRPVWRSSSTITSGPANVAAGGFVVGPQNDTVPWSLVAFRDNFDRLALVNSTTFDFRILAAGDVLDARISKAGKYAAWYVNTPMVGGTVFVYEIGTAALQTFPSLTVPAQDITQIEFSSDETALFIVRDNPNSLTRIKFATPNSPETFPPGGAAGASITSTNVDRWFVREAGNSVRLVTPVMDYPAVFTSVTTFFANPTAYAFTNCAVNCDLFVLGPNSTGPALRVAAPALPVNTFRGFASYNFDNRADYPCFSNGTTAFCVRSSDASYLPLAAHPLNFRLNEAGDRVIWTLLVGMTRGLREEAMPPAMGTTNLGTSAVGFRTGWLSPTRAFGLEASGGLRALHLVKTTGAATTATIDSDVGAQGAVVAAPLLVFPQSSTSKWRAYLGDGPIRSIPMATNIPVLGAAVRGLGTGPNAVTRYAAVSYDNSNSYIIDEPAGMVRSTSAGYAPVASVASVAAFRSGALEYFILLRLNGASAFYVYSTNAVLEYDDSATTISAPIGSPGVGAFLGLDEDKRLISAGSFLP